MALDHMVKLVVASVFGIISFVCWRYWPGFRNFLNTEHNFNLPLWQWGCIVIGIFILPFIILGILRAISCIRKREASPETPDEELLTDANDIIGSLYHWLSPQSSYLEQEKVPKRWFFRTIDDALKLAPGSAKKYLTEVLKNNVENFRIEIGNEGEETILVRYRPPQIL